MRGARRRPVAGQLAGSIGSLASPRQRALFAQIDVSEGTRVKRVHKPRVQMTSQAQQKEPVYRRVVLWLWGGELHVQHAYKAVLYTFS